MGAKLVVEKAQELDWNLENSPKLTKTFGNKPTYKGLKLALPGTLRFPIPCNKPTYKGLKRILGSLGDLGRAGNKPTYKGLKPGERVHAGGGQRP